MKKYRLDIGYVGSPFSGFQSQEDKNGIQDHLQQAMQTFLRHPVSARGSSRTDRGVHAEQQVVSFTSTVSINEFQFMRGMHALLPEGIGVRSFCQVPMEFDPINDSTGKAYRYRFWLGNCGLPMLQPYVWNIRAQTDMNLVAEFAEKFVGTHDFTSFCNQGSDAKTKTRKICEIKLVRHGPLCDLWITGEGFLKQMVRILAGTLIDLAWGKISENPQEILQAKSRCHAGLTAPGQGLTLVKVFFDEIPSIDEIISAPCNYQVNVL